MQDNHGTRATFAVIAARRIAEGDAHDAVRLCADGIAEFPEYLGGYIVLARAYDVLQRYDDAYIMRTEAHRRFPWLPWVGPLADNGTVVADSTSAVTEETPIHAPEPTPVHVPTEPTTESEPVDAVVVPLATLPSPIEAQHELANAEDQHDLSQDVQPIAIHARDDLRELPQVEPTTLIEVGISPAAPARADQGETLHTLRLIQTATTVDDKRIIRSAAVRLIPGLEFTSLRFEGVKQRGRRPIQRLQDPPPFREFHAPVRRRTMVVTPPTGTEQPTRTRPFSLEELAQRLERARLPRPESGATPVTRSAPEPRPTAEPSRSAAPVVFSETMARIYEAQGSFDLALEVYRALQQQHPERSEHFQSLMDTIIAKRGA